MVVVDQDGTLTIDEIRVRIGELNGAQLAEGIYKGNEVAELPKTLRVASDQDRDLSVRVSAWKDDVPLDVRDVEVRDVPGDSVKTITILLSAQCTDWVELKGGEALSKCESGLSCSPGTGQCGDAVVEGDDLDDFVDDEGSGGASDTTGGGGEADGTGGTGGSGSGGRRNGSGSGGSGSGGGDNTGGSPPNLVQELGGDCTGDPDFACDRTDPKQTLTCDQEKWVDAGRCDADHACTPVDGSCAEIASVCVGKMVGDTICTGSSVGTCMFNLVDVKWVEDCDGACVESTSAAECVPASCGDTIVQTAAMEECDDGNDVNDDACTELCKLPFCGDGYLNNSEECDDADEDNTDNCTSECALPKCGDGYLNGTDECDDGNSVDSDGCSNQCKGTPTSVASGAHHVCAIWGNGMVKCWGLGNFGQLGPRGPAPDGVGVDSYTTSTPKSSKPLLVDGVFGVTQLALGGSHTCALQKDGKVMCWGDNRYGQLGTGTYGGYNSIPSEVAGLSEVVKLGSGQYFTCAVKADGSAYCWGNNGNEALGEGSGSPVALYYEPTPFSVYSSGALAFAGGSGHSCFLKTNGTVECRGWNSDGQIGTSTANTAQSATAIVVPGISDATALAMGDYHSCALRSGGTVSCWGYNSSGQLGNGGTMSGPTPTTVQSLTNVTAIESFQRHTCAVRNDQTIWCWGNNPFGSLGYSGTLSTQAKPVQTSSGDFTGAIRVAPGEWHTCAQKNDRTTWCWGHNKFAQLGTAAGTATDSPVPLQIAY